MMRSRSDNAPLSILSTVAALALSLALTGAALSDTGAGDAVREQLDQLSTSRQPFDSTRRDDPEYRAVFDARHHLFIVTRIMLIGDLWRAEPTAPELIDLMPYRWANAHFIDGLDLRAELEAFAGTRSDAASILPIGWFHQARNAIDGSGDRSGDALAAAEQFTSRFPGNPRGADLLYDVSLMLEDEPEQRDAIHDRIRRHYPDSRPSLWIANRRLRADALDKPFALQFTDRLTGRPIDIQHYRGKVVIISFWSLGCGTCLTAIPHLQALDKQHRAAGLEILGINLDRTAARMLDYCRRNTLTWPQHCEEGKELDSAIARQWGVSGLPVMFLIDREGILRSVSAYGKLDELVSHWLNNAPIRP